MTTPQDWHAQGQIMELCGHDIFVIETGKAPGKPTILFIHGFPTSSWDWAPIWDRLKANYHLIALDMLGFGFSAKPKKHTYSIMEQADIIEALIPRLGLTSFHVFAHDYGDTVAQELLARQNFGAGAGKWLSLCLLNGGLFPETHQALRIQKLLLGPFGPFINILSNKRRFETSISRTFGPNTKPSQLELDSFWTLINHNKGRMVFHKLITYMTDRIQNRERWVQALKESCVPISLINGSYDPVSGSHMVDRYLEIIGPPTHLQQLGGIGHYPHMEEPDQVTKLYLNFLSQI